MKHENRNQQIHGGAGPQGRQEIQAEDYTGAAGNDAGFTEKDKARFWSKVAKSDPDKCWLWQAGKFENGYGLFSLKNKLRKAHRVSWMIENGSIPYGMLVCHKCDVPTCVNPSHLFIGTCADNHLDRNTKGRQAKGDSHGSRTKPGSLPRGASHYSTILTEGIVREIRRRSLSGETQHSLAARFGVSRSAISHILLRESWKHVI